MMKQAKMSDQILIIKNQSSISLKKKLSTHSIISFHEKIYMLSLDKYPDYYQPWNTGHEKVTAA